MNPIHVLGRLSWTAVMMVLTLVDAPITQGVVLIDSPDRNTDAPDGPLTDSGWQFQGQWGNFLGTPISDHHFITAAHVGGSIGGRFFYQGQEYRTTARWTDPETDLRIWEVDGVLPSFAPLFTGSDEVGRDLVVFGRGTQRGAEVVVDGQVKGWLWGDDDHIQSWGQNTVSEADETLLAFEFNAGGGPNESSLTGGDSGGAVFINDGGVWKLAGINFATTGRYRVAEDTSPFSAVLFNQGGLLVETDTNVFELLADAPADQPGGSFATRISTRIDWIQSVIPEPSAAALLAIGCGVLLKRRKN